MEERTEEQRQLSQRLHQESQRQYDRQQNALCYIVIGITLLVIGVIFIFLANKRENNVMVGIDPTSLAFYIMIIGLGLGTLSSVYGFVKFFISLSKRKKIITKINNLK
jgi:hypothetical protein